MLEGAEAKISEGEGATLETRDRGVTTIKISPDTTMVKVPTLTNRSNSSSKTDGMVLQ